MVGAVICRETKSQLSLTMDDNKSVTATFISDPTSVASKTSENAILVHPNPVKDQLIVESSKLEEIRIYSTMGVLLFQDLNPTGVVGMERIQKWYLYY